MANEDKNRTTIINFLPTKCIYSMILQAFLCIASSAENNGTSKKVKRLEKELDRGTHRLQGAIVDGKTGGTGETGERQTAAANSARDTNSRPD